MHDVVPPPLKKEGKSVLSAGTHWGERRRFHALQEQKNCLNEKEKHKIRQIMMKSGPGPRQCTQEVDVMKLSELHPGQSGRIELVGGEGALRQHFLDMGVIPGADHRSVQPYRA